MAEKNTISILESIKKKMQNFEKPRKPENAGFAAVGDEFDYISSSAKTDESNKKEEAKQPAQNEVKKEIAPPNPAAEGLEKEMDETFSAFLGRNSEEEKPASTQQNQAVAENKPQAEQNLQDNFLDSFADDENHQEPLAEKAEEHHDEQNNQQDLQSNHDEDAAFDFLEDHSLDEHIATKQEDKITIPDELHELNSKLDAKPQAQPTDEDHHDFDFLHDEEFHQELDSHNQPQAQQNQANTEDHHDDDMEDFLQNNSAAVDDLKEMSQRKMPPQIKQMPVAPSFETVNQKPQQYPAIETKNNFPKNEIADNFNEDEFLNADESKLRQEYAQTRKNISTPDLTRNIAAQVTQNRGSQASLAAESILKGQAFDQTSESLKKLFDAKNAVSTVASFTKSDNLNEIALQLLEPKLEKWLNENLPALIDKIVREEINKIMPK